MSFIKRGDGKIVTVIDEEELTEEQKKSAKDLSQQVKQSDNTEASELKQSGR
ncbi:hypothetical protein UFOVP1290_620 [uncultured Caudovirales phage]|uniref:Uncharacterized protein n=1 Tax=uncultured Caudovirales phage TaxID=2100421 RepID=A0A6J5RHZ2_9CAUD|nr:hypothetical protein UFOVP1290_620 [uncultured Caudovirales phage]